MRDLIEEARLRREPRLLPGLARALAEPMNAPVRAEIESTLRELVAIAAVRASSAVPADVVERIQRRINELPNAGWPTSVCKEHNALPIHGTSALFLWSIRPDGTVWCTDLDTLRNETEAERDPLVRFAVVVQGAKQFPELAEILPNPPPTARPCGSCAATGTEGAASCVGCRGLGWRGA